jgi:hypothetical protein
MCREKMSFISGTLGIQVSDISDMKEVFDIVRECHNADVTIFMWEKKFCFDLESLTVDQLLIILDKVKKFCIPVRTAIRNVVYEFNSEGGKDIDASKNESRNLAYMDGELKMRVLDIKKAFDIVLKYNVLAATTLSVKDRTIEFDLEYLTIEQLISILQDLYFQIG